MRASTLLSLPNALSLSRLALAPLFVVWRQPELRVGLLVLAGATDVLDGWLARRQRTTSRLGAILDPVADRTFVLVAMAALVADGLLAPAHALLLLGRDLMTTVGFVVARTARRLRGVRLEARPAGKLVTVLQLATLFAVLLRPGIVGAMAVATMLVAVVAVADYTRALWRARAAVAALAVLAGFAALAASPAGAQRRPGAPATQVEARADLLAGSATTLHGGVGLLQRAGRYVQVGLALGAGTTRRDLTAADAAAGRDATVASGRAELVARFVVDPFADPFVPPRTDPRWLLYGGAGGGVLFARDASPQTRVFVSLGVTGPPRGGWRPALEIGLGGGTRIGLALQRD